MAERALVTGAAQRLGRAMARALASDGVAVAVHYAGSAAAAAGLVAEIAGRPFGRQGPVRGLAPYL